LKEGQHLENIGESKTDASFLGGGQWIAQLNRRKGGKNGDRTLQTKPWGTYAAVGGAGRGGPTKNRGRKRGRGKLTCLRGEGAGVPRKGFYEKRGGASDGRLGRTTFFDSIPPPGLKDSNVGREERTPVVLGQKWLAKEIKLVIFLGEEFDGHPEKN